MLVLAAEQCRRGHFWVVVAERDPVLFRYTKKHNGSVPADLLASFKGYVIADARASTTSCTATSPAFPAGRMRGGVGKKLSPPSASARSSPSASSDCSTTRTTRRPTRPPASPTRASAGLLSNRFEAAPPMDRSRAAEARGRLADRRSDELSAQPSRCPDSSRTVDCQGSAYRIVLGSAKQIR